MMKRMLLVFPLVFVVFSGLYAESLLSGPYNFKFYSGIGAKPSTFNNNWGILCSMQNLIKVNNAFLFGFEIDGLIPSIPAPQPTVSNTEVEMTVMAGVIGVTFFDSSVFHFYQTTMIGTGGILDESFFVLEPRLGLELNITEFVQMDLEAGYRYIKGIEHDLGLNDSDLAGFNVNLMLKFKWLDFTL